MTSHFNEFLGRYVHVNSSPSAWYGYLLDVEWANGTPTVLLADAALWTQGMTKDLIRPGNRMGPDRENLASRLGLVSVVTLAIQESGWPGSDNGYGLAAPMSSINAMLADVSSDTVAAVVAASARRDKALTKPQTNDPYLDIEAVVQATGDALPGFPRRVAASLILHHSRRPARH